MPTLSHPNQGRRQKLRRILLNRYFLVPVITLVLIFSWLEREWDELREQPVTSWAAEIHADCGVALTGGAGRIKEGFDLLAHKAIHKLIIAGVYPNLGLRDLIPLWPFYGDLNEDDIYLDHHSGTTYGNAVQTLPIVEAFHCRDVVLITSSLHMSRAFKTFRAAFPDKIAIYQHSVVSSLGESTWSEMSLEILKTRFYAIFAF